MNRAIAIKPTAIRGKMRRDLKFTLKDLYLCFKFKMSFIFFEEKKQILPLGLHLSTSIHMI